LHSHVQHGGLPVERFVRLINEDKKVWRRLPVLLCSSK